MTSQIKTIEDLSLNAWPSHQMQVYDGWIIRFSHFYTHRTNSVEEIGASSLPLEEKVTYCEEIYSRWKTPSIFKITPLSDPALEPLLVEKEYRIEHATDVMTLDLTDTDSIAVANVDTDVAAEVNSDMAAARITVRVEDHISSDWIESLFRLKNTTNTVHQKIVPSMYAAIPKDVIAVSIWDNGVCIATGLGILDRDYIGIYAIHVEEQYRKNGYAKALLFTLLKKGQEAGASRAYLQVVSNNLPARLLYEKIGFRKLYSYLFRVKRF